MLISLIDVTTQTILQNWQFSQETVIKIGRSPDNQVIIDHPLVSRYHLELQNHQNQWTLISYGTNGTYVDDKVVTQLTIIKEATLQLAPNGPVIKLQISCSHANNPANNLFCIHCGQPIKIEATVRQYQILKILGQGGMGTTYVAWDEKKAREIKGSPSNFLVVLKEMNADMLQIQKAQELFDREGETLQKLNHPGIPKFFDFFVEQGKKYLAMEMIHGQDLEKRVFTKGPVNIDQAVTWMLQTCEILDYLHSQEPPIIHRDIKPANLLVRHRDNRIIVLDFGAVKEIGTPPGTRIGVEGYTAPEQARGQASRQSDLYAIGPSLVFLLTGQSPQKFAIIKGEGYQLDLGKIPAITPKLKKVIEKATEIKVRDRYQTAQELMEALKLAIS